MAFTATAYEDMPVAGASPLFTPAVYLAATCAVVQVDGGSVRFRLDGVPPRAGSGMLAEERSLIYLDSPDQIQRFRAVDEGQAVTLRAQFGYGLEGGFRVLTPSLTVVSSGQGEPEAELAAIRLGIELLVQHFTEDDVELLALAAVT